MRCGAIETVSHRDAELAAAEFRRTRVRVIAKDSRRSDDAYGVGPHALIPGGKTLSETSCVVKDVAVTWPMLPTRYRFSWISLGRNFASLESFECPTAGIASSGPV